MSKTRLPSSLCLIDTAEIKSSDAMRNLILRTDESSQTIKKAMAQSLKNLNPDRIYRLTSHNEDLKNFCRDQLDVQTAWAEKFLKGKYPSIPIDTLDGRHISIYDLLMGTSLYSAFRNEKTGSTFRLTLIDEACNWGCYDALVLRCQIKLTELKKIGMPLNDEQALKHEAAIEMILWDANLLAMNYWGIGYVRAGTALDQLAILLDVQAQVDTDSEKTKMTADAFISQSKTLQEVAVKYFLCAYLLEAQPFSQTLMNDVTQGLGILSVWRDTSAFSDWTAAKQQFQEWLTPDIYNLVEAQAKLVITEQLKKVNDRKAVATQKSRLFNSSKATVVNATNDLTAGPKNI